MDTMHIERTEGHTALGRVEQITYRRGVEDGLARTPATIDSVVARSAPALVRAYGDGYQWGARHRPRFSSLLSGLRLGRRTHPNPSR